LIGFNPRRQRVKGDLILFYSHSHSIRNILFLFSSVLWCCCGRIKFVLLLLLLLGDAWASSLCMILLQQFLTRKPSCTWQRWHMGHNSLFFTVNACYQLLLIIGILFPTHPCLTPPLRRTRQNFWIKLIAQKLEGLGYSVVKAAWS